MSKTRAVLRANIKNGSPAKAVQPPAEGFECVGVPWWEVPLQWEAVEPYVKMILGDLDWRFSIADIYRLLLTRDMQLWTAVKAGSTEAAALTMIRVYPRAKAVMIAGVAGRGLDHWIGFEERIAQWAASLGCIKLEAIGRPGWLKKAPPSWRMTGVLIEREIETTRQDDGKPERRHLDHGSEKRPVGRAAALPQDRNGAGGNVAQ